MLLVVDILKLINTYKNDPAIKYNINIKSLHDIKEPLEELNNMIVMNELKNNIVDQILYFIQELHKGNLSSGDFMHTVIYGPPGTGKTTTIINLINAYQDKVGIKNKDLVIHLNASDERGIDIIRNQISNFVNSKPLFHSGMKFVILDEVDYMTKNAQQALRYLLQNYSNNVRFCLICNYISKIDEGLQNEFIRLRFNQLPNFTKDSRKVCLRYT
jgi:DNA polymerase III delta prime subunit